MQKEKLDSDHIRHRCNSRHKKPDTDHSIPVRINAIPRRPNTAPDYYCYWDNIADAAAINNRHQSNLAKDRIGYLFDSSGNSMQFLIAYLMAANSTP